MKYASIALLVVFSGHIFGYEYTASPHAFDGKTFQYKADDHNDYVISFVNGRVAISGFSKMLNAEENGWSGSGSGDINSDICSVTVSSKDYDITMTIHEDKIVNISSVTEFRIHLKKE